MGPLTRPDLVDPLIAGFIASIEAEAKALAEASLAEAAPAAQILPFSSAARGQAQHQDCAGVPGPGRQY
jgi:hypothetical protein